MERHATPSAIPFASSLDKTKVPSDCLGTASIASTCASLASEDSLCLSWCDSSRSVSSLGEDDAASCKSFDGALLEEDGASKSTDRREDRVCVEVGDSVQKDRIVAGADRELCALRRIGRVHDFRELCSLKGDLADAPNALRRVRRSSGFKELLDQRLRATQTGQNCEKDGHGSTHPGKFFDRALTLR